MKNKLVKRILSVGLTSVLAVTLLAGCGKGGDSGNESANGNVGDDEFAGKGTDFTWWITQTDSSGEYYDDYADNTAVQFINQQYWDSVNGGIGTEETGRKLNFSFLVPVTGSEMENFNTMIGTGEYPDILSLAMSSESPEALYENGVLMDITEYVEKYMPNYVAYLDANPELKPLVQVTDEEGNVHYRALYPFMDGVNSPWAGMCYRRDWVVKYAKPTEYVWDLESDYVKENGHPAVTPLAKAIDEDNLEGWLDPAFNTRSNDMFFMIDTTGVNQGKVGMWYGLTSTLGAGIRTSCQNSDDQKDAYVMGAALPLNDMYGTEKQMFVAPDAVYQDSRRGLPIGITNKAEGKDLATLFTYFD